MLFIPTGVIKNIKKIHWLFYWFTDLPEIFMLYRIIFSVYVLISYFFYGISRYTKTTHMKNTILLFLALFVIHITYSQTVTGTVTDNSGSPLPGVSIVVEGTNKGTTTDFDGNYSIAATTDDVLQFSFLGMLTQNLTVSTARQINVVMEEDAESLDEVIVTALGIKREKKSVGYATQQLETEEILNVPETNIVTALQGKVAGAQITRGGGAPGQGSRITLRGINSLNPNANNQPLFVVDGIPISNDTFTVGGGALRGLSNRAGDIDLNDVENISVLKGGAATALYGVRAANGAIIITTRTGKSGKAQFNLSTTSGIDYVNKFPITQGVYTQGFNGEYDPNSFWPTWGPTIAEAQAIDPTHPDKIFNNYKNAYGTGYNTNIHFDASGGFEKAFFYASVARFQQDGVIPFADFERKSAKINGTVKLNDKLSFIGSANFINSGGDRVQVSAFNERLIYWADRVDVNDFEFTEGPLAGTMKGYRNNGGNGNNPIYGAKTNKFVDDVNRLIGNLGFNYKLFEGLDISYRFGIDYYSDSRTATAPGPTGVEGENIFGGNGDGFINETRIISEDLTSNLIISFNKDLGDDFNLTLRGGLDIFQQGYNRVTTNGDNLDVFNFFHLSNASTITTSQLIQKTRVVGLYGEFGLSFRDYLFLTVTDRNDWSSTLPVQNRSFNYPSVSLSYLFSESFTLPEWFTYGKLRASYAQIGKDAIGPYLTSDVYRTASQGDEFFPVGDVTGWTRPNNKADFDIRSELTTEIEVGAEVKLFNNRLGFDVAWYKSNAKDQILAVPIANSSGYQTFTTNAGELQNSGVEVILNATPLQTKDFSWDINVNFSTNNNEVVSIREGSESIFLGSNFGYIGSSGSQALYAGLAYGNILGTSYRRYYENPADEDPLILDKSRPLLIGEDGFPIIDSEQKIIGNSTPEWLMNIGNQINYKNFTLGFNFDFRQGFEKFNSLDNFMAAFGKATYTLDRNDIKVFEGVTADGSPNTQEVFLGQADPPDGFTTLNGGFYRAIYRGVTENFVEDASWVRLQSLSLTYRLPSTVVERVGMTRASISVSGTNLWIDTDYSGFDPESTISLGNAEGFNGLDVHPGLKTYAATLKLTF